MESRTGLGAQNVVEDGELKSSAEKGPGLAGHRGPVSGTHRPQGRVQSGGRRPHRHAGHELSQIGGGAAVGVEGAG